MNTPTRPKRASARNPTLGPVDDLERHLGADWWRGLFNALYLQTDADVVENAVQTSAEVSELVRAASLSPSDSILDLCCGQGRHALELVRQGFANVTGLDQSKYLLRVARRRARAEGLDVRFFEGDARSFTLEPESFDCVAILGNSFGYFDRPDDDRAVLDAARTVLKSTGRLALDLTDGDWMRRNFAPRSWEWIGPQQLTVRERSLASDGTRLVCREIVIDAKKGVLADQFYAQRLYGRDDVERLLLHAGFGSVVEHDGFDQREDADHDFGMMEHRRFWTASRDAQRRVFAIEGPKRDVLVLFGDPSLPDPVKPDGRFAAEDLELVAKTKATLARIEAFRFRYHDHHASLVAELSRHPPDMVLNFCDEGFQNDGRRELHIPALLDLVGVPYSGSDPRCLALCLDKAAVSAVAKSVGVSAPREVYIGLGDEPVVPADLFPLLLKPNACDGSFGIAREGTARTPAALPKALAWMRTTFPGQPLLAQEMLSGLELSVGVVGNTGEGLRALPLLEVDYSRLDPSLPPILAYESKWHPQSPYWKGIAYRRAPANHPAERAVVDAALRLFARLGCRDYARFDFRLDAGGVPKVLDVNPNPSWCDDGELALMASWADIGYEDFLRTIVNAAWSRVDRRVERTANASKASSRQPQDAA